MTGSTSRDPRLASPAPARPKRSRQGALAPLVASLLVLGVFATAIGVGRALGMPMPSLSLDLASWHLSSSSGWSTLPASTPTRVSISSIGVRADVVQVGLASDGSIATPVDKPGSTVGWYGYGPTPGELGTAVLVGHVDTANQAGVFHRLRDLPPGKVVEVTRKDHRIATFRVDSVETFPKTEFPADRVLTQNDAARLVLVTCGGNWVGGEEGYADNVIVFAHLT
jgi:hypothetical protein